MSTKDVIKSYQLSRTVNDGVGLPSVRHRPAIKPPTTSNDHVASKSSSILTKCLMVCEKAQRTIVANLKAKKPTDTENSGGRSSSGLSAALQIEQKLWTDMAKFKETRNAQVMKFIKGFYATLLTEVIKTTNHHLVQSTMTSCLRFTFRFC